MNPVNKIKDKFLEDLFEFLGNIAPTEEQIKLLKDLVSTAYVKKELILSNKLSSREQTCLYLAALGKSARETGDILKLKVSTVITYRKEAIRKLGCRNLAQAVFNGIRFDLFT